ncbi:MAG: hypothetical protein B6D73_10730 [gamma proteobacterium symbiont of Stewartia floridana]|nr:MAG: hypothetical protein B6D73_10730 [gamma proteobacterium symbiont of Stewartia floridana]
MSWKPVSKFTINGEIVDSNKSLLRKIIPALISNSRIDDESSYIQLTQYIKPNVYVAGLMDGTIAAMRYGIPAVNLSDVENKFLEICTQAFSLQAATPSSPLKRERFLHLFCDGEQCYPTLKKFILDTVKTNKSKSVACLVRGRGTGKSTIQNRILNEDLDEIEKHKCIVCRCDVSKLYDHVFMRGAEVSINDYLRMQLLRVLIDSIKLNEDTDITAKRYRVYRNILNQLESTQELINIDGAGTSYRKALSDCIDYVRDYNSDEHSSNMNVVTQLFVEDSNARNDKARPHRSLDFVKFLQLGKKATEIARSLGLRMYYFLDGVDNVIWHYEDQRPHFKKIVHQISEIIANPDKKTFYLIAMRPEFYDELGNEPVQMPSLEQRVIDPETDTEQVPLPILDEKKNYGECIFNKKIKACTDIRFLDKYYSEEMKEIRSHANYKVELDHCFTVFNEVAETYQTSIVNTLKHSLGHKPKVGLLDAAYNGNFRGLSHNLISYVRTELQAQKLHQHVDPALVSREAYRNLFLHGKRLIRSTPRRDNSAYYASVFPNPFYYDIDSIKKRQGVWQGLVFIRVAQLLKHFEEFPISQSKVRKILAEAFDYEESLIDKQIEKGVTYGLINFVTGGDNDRMELTLTKSGDCMVWLSLNKPDIMMYLAFDTHIDSESAALIKRLVTSTSPDDLRYCFPETMVFVATAFSAFIAGVYRNEADLLTTNVHKLRKYGLKGDIPDSVFAIDSLDKIMKFTQDEQAGKLDGLFQWDNRPFEDYGQILGDMSRILEPTKENGLEERPVEFHHDDWVQLNNVLNTGLELSRYGPAST